MPNGSPINIVTTDVKKVMIIGRNIDTIVDGTKNITRVRNCPDVKILNSLFGLLSFVLLPCCIFVMMSLVFLSFCVFVFLSRHHVDQMCEGSQV